MRTGDTVPADVAALAGVLGNLSESERRAVIDHVRGLAAMPAERRAAVLLLSGGGGASE